MSDSSRLVTCPLTNEQYCNYLNRKTLLAQRAQRIVATYVLESVGRGSNRPHCDGGKKNVGWVSESVTQQTTNSAHVSYIRQNAIQLYGSCDDASASNDNSDPYNKVIQ